MKRRIVVLILTFVMVTMSVAGCGRSENDKKDEPATERVEEPENKPEEADPVESTDEVDVAEPEDTNQEDVDSTDSNEQASEPATSGEETPDATEEMNEYGLTETQMQKLYECVKESVLKGYIEPNGMDPSEFQWPAPDETHDNAPWAYLGIIFGNYVNSGEKYSFDAVQYKKPDDSMCQLMNSVFDGMVAWGEIYQEKIYKARVSSLPMDKLFPENISFAD